ncbi:hypothetical protein CP532_6478 [Ophiocordyceps camponoti-leonardi (nom. inval.)]|nr:hypothetical protein CP532_6478 [Ophiocordyceps camponoti-leonardi (nom. inval.)]
MLPAAAPPGGPSTSRPVFSPEEQQDDSRSSSSATSPAPPDNEESDFFLGANDSQSSLGVPNFQDMQVDDACWPPVNRLPNEILIGIFAKLSSPSDLYHCLLVSRRWARNAVDLLWHRPACTSWRNHSIICQTLGLQRPFFSYCDFIKRLNLATLADKVNDGSVLPLAVCSRVERLTLTNCRGLTDSGLMALVENSASLQALDISNDKNITEQSVRAIAEHCRRLQGLNISGCDAISNESMITLAQSCKYIKRLKLNECAQLRDDAILAFAEHCPNILEIDLHQCNAIGNGPVTALLAKGNCLRELRLACCDLIDDSAFLSLPENQVYEHLRILDLTSCARLTDAAVDKIIEVAPRLRNLVLAKCRNITDAAVHSIARLNKNLHYVHLGHCGQITDEGVKKLVNSCNRIRYIDLGCCTNLTDESVKRLALLPKLKRIGLVKCSSITDESVFALAEAAYRPRVRKDPNGVYVGGEYYASSLERVHLSYCVNLTLKVEKLSLLSTARPRLANERNAQSIMRLLNSCPRLTHLSLTGVAAFQREDFQVFCRHAPPEFTQHQRDVFCVFSGSMVSQFREFLNTSSRFEELRENLPFRAGGSRIRGAAARRSQAMANALPMTDGEGFDDEMADEDNDFAALESGEMAVDAHVQNPAGSHAFRPASMGIPAPSLVQYPLASSSTSHSHPAAQHHGFHLAPMGPMGPLHLSSLMSPDPADGGPHPNAYGQAQAMFATLASELDPSSQPASSAALGGGASGASTAPMPPRRHDSPQE